MGRDGFVCPSVVLFPLENVSTETSRKYEHYNQNVNGRADQAFRPFSEYKLVFNFRSRSFHRAHLTMLCKIFS